MGSTHKDLTLDNNHAVPARIFTDIAARDTDVAFNTNSQNINKLVRVDSPLSYYMLTSITPTWLEFSSTSNDEFTELTDVPSTISANLILQGNAAGTALEFGQNLTPTGNPIFNNLTLSALNMSSQLINSVLDPVAAQDAATKNYVDIQNTNQVTNVGTSTDNALTRFDGTTGKLIHNSLIIVDDAGVMTGLPEIRRENATQFLLRAHNTLVTNFTRRGEFSIVAESVQMAHDVGDGAGGVSTSSHIIINDLVMQVADTINLRGLLYEADYSSNFADRSLIDKAYVDSHINTVGVNLPDNVSILLGTGNDLTLVHDGTDSKIQNTTGNLFIQNSNVTGKIIERLGSTTNLTTFVVQDSAGASLFNVFGNGDVKIPGNLIVEGTRFITNSEVVNIADNHLYLNSGYGTTVAQSGGLVVNFLPTSTVAIVTNKVFDPGVISSFGPTVQTDLASVFSPSDIIQISGTPNGENDGIFEVLIHEAFELEIRGIGGTATVEDFTGNQFVENSGASATITKINVSVIRANTNDGTWETGKGSQTGIVFNTIQNTGGILDDLNTLGAPTADGQFIVATGSGVFAYESGSVARNSIGLGDSDTPIFKNLRLEEIVDGTATLLFLTNTQAHAASSINETSEIRFGFGSDSDVARIVAGKIRDYTTSILSDSFLAFYTDRDSVVTEAMRIDELGSLGIGTTNPFAVGLTISSTSARIYLEDTGATVNNKLWSIEAEEEDLFFRTRVDDASTFVTWLEVLRTGTAIDDIKFSQGNVAIGSGTRRASLHNMAGNTLLGVRNTSSETIHSLSSDITHIVSPTNMGPVDGTVETALRLFRDGTTSTKFNSTADFQIGSYATSGINAQSQLTLRLGEANVHIPDKDIMIWRADGKVGIGAAIPDSILTIDLGGVNGNIVTNFGVHVLADAGENTGFVGFDLTLDNSTNNASGYLRLARTSATIYLGMEIAADSRDGIRFLTGDGSETERMRINSQGRVVVGATTADAQFHIDQPSTTGSIPVLHLTQLDVSEQMISFSATEGVGNAIEAKASKVLTTTHFVKVVINGVTKYIECGTIA